MLKQLVVDFVIEKGDKKYVFSMPHGANFGEAYDACFAVLQDIMDMSKQAADQAKRAEDPAVPEEKVEVVG